jgi:hypothetical protein
MLVTFSARRSVELFHLAILRALVARGEDKRLFSLKGGCNLRFFCRSVRLAIVFDEYAAQVVAFLDPDQQMLFEDRSAWDAMQGEVIQRLEALQ